MKIEPFIINGVPNSTQIPPCATQIVQRLPFTVKPGKTLIVERIRCALGFYTPTGQGLILEIYASDPGSTTPLDGIVRSSGSIADETPEEPIIYTNCGCECVTVIVTIAEVNKTGCVLHTDMPDSWWVSLRMV